MDTIRDVFLCHASEDKQTYLRPLVKAIHEAGISYWYDEAEIAWGDSITQKVNEGLAMSRFVIVFISQAFLSKNWPKRELSAALNIEANSGEVRVLPLLADESIRDKVRQEFPLINDKLYLVWSSNPSSIVTQLERRIGKKNNAQRLASKDAGGRVARVDFGFKRLLIRSERHQYSLVATVTLEQPPTQGEWLLKLLWPIDVKIIRAESVATVREVIIEGTRYKELRLHSKERIWPGETVDALGTEGAATLDYEFDHPTWRLLEDHPRELRFTFYLEDHPPVEGRVPFSELNCF